MLERFGRLDGLLHNAGILGTLSPIEHYDVPTWCRVLHVNVTAAFALTKVIAAGAEAVERRYRSLSRRAPLADTGALTGAHTRSPSSQLKASCRCWRRKWKTLPQYE